MASYLSDITGTTDIIIALIGAMGFIVIIPILFTILSKSKRLEKKIFARTFLKKMKWPLAFFSAFALIHVSSLERIFENREIVNDITAVLLIIALTWFLLNFIRVIKAVVHEKYPIDTPDNLDERKLRTQYQYIHAILSIAIVILGVALIFFQFDKLRIIGAGLLASAGLAAIIVAFTAQKTLSDLIAGFQIAFTQPFRIDDIVIVEGEWGKIEEITLTYVVVRIWDQRRLVLPVSYFINKPFQNWTRTTSDIWGTVMIYVDYTVPVEAVRKELERIVKTTDLWDGKVVSLQVTDTSDRTVTLRALVSAKDASDAWDLRCMVRERLIEFLQREYPDSLPRIRIDNMENQ